MTRHFTGTGLEHLVSQSKLGDSTALHKLCQAHAQSVFQRSQRILGNREDAEDVAQEVMIKVCTKISGLKEPKAFNAWLARIVVRESMKLLAHNSRYPAVSDASAFLDLLEEKDKDSLPLEHALYVEEHQTVTALIAKLSLRQRQAVVLHYFYGLNVTETGKAMGITQQAVSRYLKLARAKVGRAIAEAAGQSAEGSA